jgi:hypothetical protein
MPGEEWAPRPFLIMRLPVCLAALPALFRRIRRQYMPLRQPHPDPGRVRDQEQIGDAHNQK